MKQVLRITASILVLFMIFAALVGCGGPSDTQGKHDDTASAEESTAASETASRQDSETVEAEETERASAAGTETASLSEPESESASEAEARPAGLPAETQLGIANVAVGCPVITNSCEGGSNQLLTDGDPSTYWRTVMSTAAENRTFAYTAELDLTRSYPICGLILHGESSYMPGVVRIEISENGLDFTTVEHTVTAEKDGTLELTFHATARFLRIISVDLGERSAYGLKLSEAEVLSEITNYDNLLPNKRALVMQPGATDLLTASHRIPSEGAEPLRFLSSRPEVVRVDESTGAIRALANGKATVYVTDGVNCTAIPVTVHTPDPAYRISTFYLPTDGENTRQVMALLKESGVNFIENCRSRDSYGNVTGEYLRVMAADYGMTTLIAYPSSLRTMSDEEVRSVAAKYKNLPGYGGLYLVDEPLEPNTYAHLYKTIVAEDPFCTPHLNLFPPFAKISDYQGYVTDWLATAGGSALRMLSYDDYPFTTSAKSFRSSVYDSLDTIRRAALLYDAVDTGYYIQAMGLYDAYRIPNDAEILYHASLGVAYGMKSYSYFVWFTPPYTGSGEHFITGILTPEMEKSEMFEGVKAASQMLNTLSPMLANTDAVEVYHYKGQDGEPIPADFCLLSERASAIYSLLVDRTTKQQYIVVVNKRFFRDIEITFKVRDSSLTELCEVSSGEERIFPVVNGKVTTDMGAGALLVFKLPEGYDARQDNSVNDGTEKSLLTDVGATVNSSASNGQYVYMLNDGDRTGTGWATNMDCDTAEIVYDLKTASAFNRVDIYPLLGSFAAFPQAISVWVSEDGESYRKVAERTDISLDDWSSITFETVTARYIRFSIDAMAGFGKPLAAIGEIELYADNGNLPPMSSFETQEEELPPEVVLTPAQAGAAGIAYDAVMIDGEMKVNGSAAPWLDGQNNTVNATERLIFFGWAGFGQPIDAFGYQLDSEAPVWSSGFASSAESAVLAAGGAHAARFQISVPLSDLSGSHTLTFLIKLEDGTLVLLHKPLTVILP